MYTKSSLHLKFSCMALLFVFLFGQISLAENPSSNTAISQAPADSLKTLDANQAKKTADSLDVLNHSPRKATIYSTILPGLGQAYNKKYWKIPIVYAGFGAMAYFFVNNNNKYQGFKKALILRNDGDESTVDAYATQYPNQSSLVEYKDYYRRNRDLSVIGFSLFYILNIVDANVDANLYYFDVSDDLSLQWAPSLPAFPGSFAGICLKAKF